MNLADLKKEIPYKWRVQSYSKSKASASCVAYIDARDVMDILDEVCGPQNWQDDYKTVDGKLFGGIGIKIEDYWVWKWDTGTESQVEQEKGQVSDAFKRAGVHWGIGRFLYSLDIAYLPTSGKKDDSNKWPKVVDDSGKPVWDLTRHINKMRARYNGVHEPDIMTAPMFSSSLSEIKDIFDKKGIIAVYKKYLKDNYGTYNEVQLLKNNLKDSQHIIDGLRGAYQGGKNA